MTALIKWEDKSGTKFEKKFSSGNRACDFSMSLSWKEGIDIIELFFREKPEEEWCLIHEMNKRIGLDKYHARVV